MKRTDILISILLTCTKICNAFTLAPVIVRTRSFSAEESMVLEAAPKRLDDNADGVLYVNDRCIDCSACSNFAPSVFERASVKSGAQLSYRRHHRVHTQPQSEQDIINARAALAACPVAAIRVENKAHRNHRGQLELSSQEQSLAKDLALSPKVNGRELPFPRKLVDNVWYLGHHNERSFGATPYLAIVPATKNDDNDHGTVVMIDTPRYCNSAVKAVTSIAPQGPDYLFLTHVDDTADHEKWRDHFPKMKRIFHAGDTGPHNWLGDLSLENVEVLLQENISHKSSIEENKLQAFSLDGTLLTNQETRTHKAVIYHTPGHSPGSISLLYNKILFTGDTLGYTPRTKSLTGFPRYGNDLHRQVLTLNQLEALDWEIVAPGHGHVRDFRASYMDRKKELQDAKTELQQFAQGTKSY